MEKEIAHNNKKYLALFYDKCRQLTEEDFSPAEIGEIITAAIKYELYGEDTTLSDRSMRLVYKNIKTDIDISTEKANKRSAAGQRNASIRWDKSQNMTLEEMDAEIDEKFPRRYK